MFPSLEVSNNFLKDCLNAKNKRTKFMNKNSGSLLKKKKKL